MQEFLEYLLKKIVDNPSGVSVAKIEENESITFSIKVDETDAGKIIGKKGKTINSIKKLLLLAQYRMGAQTAPRIYLRLEENL